MRAMVLDAPAPIESRPLRLVDLPVPDPGPGEIRVRVRLCGVCRTDLHVVEGDLAPQRSPIVPGHQVVGVVDALGAGCRRLAVGQRVGIAWLRATCGTCAYCRRGAENLCPAARFTGWHEHGGYAERAVVREDFAYALPDVIADAEASPLLCAGIIGYRALRRANIQPGCRLGLYGFGASAHIAIQVARHLGCRVFVMTREARHRALATTLGAEWTGGATDPPPEPLDSAVLFAPAGELVPPALAALDRGGTLALAGIYLTDVPPLDYQRHLFYERTLQSVTANTRQDGIDLLRIAAEIPIRPHTVPFKLEQANDALRQLKHDGFEGAAVLQVT
ncbi:MAG TPA: zinc-dependent alcohol dehydrogenase family protein [Candidatus Dormibacteraeota bacterium]|nr:zinc-dependent alcohol dehydrogenase family protein [Candidatus Dormibacteraeota bacterium]